MTLDTSQTCRLAEEDVPRRLLLQWADSLYNNVQSSVPDGARCQDRHWRTVTCTLTWI